MMAAKNTKVRTKPSHRGVKQKQYHHGALRGALMDVTDTILAERGIEGFTLREAARRAGVSPQAPAHHFGSAAGLLTEVAILGFTELTHRLKEAGERGGADARARLIEQGLAYVRFALAYPGRFQLMFSHSKLRPADVRVHVAAEAAHAELEKTVRAHLGVSANHLSDNKVAAAVLGAWSIAHGFAQLTVDGKLDLMIGPDGLSAFVDRMFPAALSAMWER
jgi:AcrR family transcriptional regulator